MTNPAAKDAELYLRRTKELEEQLAVARAQNQAFREMLGALQEFFQAQRDSLAEVNAAFQRQQGPT